MRRYEPKQLHHGGLEEDPAVHVGAVVTSETTVLEEIAPIAIGVVFVFAGVMFLLTLSRLTGT